MNRLRRTFQLFTAIACTFAGSTLSAQIVNNGIPDNHNGIEFSSPDAAANDFTLSSRTALTTLNWWAISRNLSAPTANVQFFLNFLSDAGGTLGADLASQSGSGTGTLTNFGCCSGIPSGDDDHHSYLFSTNLGGLTLDPGTYWVSVAMSDADANVWYWANSAESGDQLYLEGGLDGLVHPTDTEGAFDLDGVPAPPEVPPVTATPEPATMSLMATGLFGLAGAVRRRKNKSDGSAVD